MIKQSSTRMDVVDCIVIHDFVSRSIKELGLHS